MGQWSIRQRIGSTDVLAVPSVHFRVPFAQAVNRLCSGGERPDAVVVELGHGSATAAEVWIKELGLDGRHLFEMPCMLGIATPVRRVSVSLKKRIWQLQATKGLALRDLPMELLRDELGIPNVSVLYLSPTDSMVEAIRCAVELDIPLYGVDLEDTPHSEREDPHIQDPTSSHERLQEFVEQNCRFAALSRMEEIDGRREFAMAARLRGIARKHRRILFVCGMAHWPALASMLNDEDILPAPLPEVCTPVNGFTRVLIHPGLAIYHMDLFPVIADEYETLRTSALKPPGGRRKLVHASSVFRLLLEDAYESYFGSLDDTGKPSDRSVDLENRKAFEQLLANLCLVKGLEVPDLFTTLEAAQAVMSQPFCSVLASSLMNFDWSIPEEFPELPLLHHVNSTTRSQLKAEYRDRAGRRSKSFLVESRPGDTPLVRVPLPWEWAQKTNRDSPRTKSIAGKRPPDVSAEAGHPPECDEARDQELPQERKGQSDSSRPGDAGPAEPKKDAETCDRIVPPDCSADEAMEEERVCEPSGADTLIREEGDEERREAQEEGREANWHAQVDDQADSLGCQQSGDGGVPSDREESPQDPASKEHAASSNQEEVPAKDHRRDENQKQADSPDQERLYQIPDSVVYQERPVKGMRRTWPPEGAILTLLAIRADQIMGTGPNDRCTEQFAGDLLEGLDVRATLRARARGDSAIYVRGRSRTRTTSRNRTVGPSPTVFILDPGRSKRGYLYVHGTLLKEIKTRGLVRRPMRLDAVVEELGAFYVDGLTYIEPCARSDAKRSANIGVYRARGILSFGPPCFDMCEEALWFEDENVDYAQTPILHGTEVRDVVKMYQERHGLDLDPEDWPNFLVRAAIPYSPGLLNVVSEQGVRLASSLDAEAARHGVRIRRVPVSMFPPDYIRKASYIHHANPFDDESGEYPETVVRAMGERWDAYRELLPQELKDYRSRRLSKKR